MLNTVQFSQLDLVEPIQRALTAEKHVAPTPIQAKAIPHLLQGRDLLGQAEAGAGKTVAFTLPILQHLSIDRHPAGPRKARALILTTSRERVQHIQESFRAYGRFVRLSQATVYEGPGKAAQAQALSRGIDILIGTPGRVMELINAGQLELNKLEIMVLDETDRMLELGVTNELRSIFEAAPTERQTIVFATTLPAEIKQLCDNLLTDPVTVLANPPAPRLITTAQSARIRDTEARRRVRDLLPERMGAGRR